MEPGALSIILKNTLSGKIKEGSELEEFEKRFAEYVGTKYAISVASGRAALYYIYRFFLKDGQKVILPSYTCIPAIDAARWAGGKPVFLDIDLNSYNPKFENSVEKERNVGAISLSYLYGLVGDIKPFLDYAKTNNIAVIEDSAIALGASYKNKNVGSIGDAGVFSLQESKIFTSWRGGVVTTNNKELYDYIKNIRDEQEFPFTGKLLFNLSFSYKRKILSNPNLYGSTMYPLKKVMTSKKFKSILQNIMGFNPLESIDGMSPLLMPKTDKFRFTNTQAAVALLSLNRINKIIRKRRKSAKFLSDELKSIVDVPIEGKDVRHAYGRFPIRISGKSKFSLHNHFLKRGIETSLNYPYIIPKTKFMINYKHVKFPNSQKASNETLLLPFHTYLKDKDLEIIVKAVKELK